MKIRTNIIPLAILFFFMSCKTDQVSVRLQNISNYDFKEITVRLGDSIKTFKNLKQGFKTDKFKTNTTYGYCYTHIILANNDTVNLKPIDYVGEKLYKRGKIKIQFKIIKNKKSNTYHVLIKTKRRI